MRLINYLLNSAEWARPLLRSSQWRASALLVSPFASPIATFQKIKQVRELEEMLK